jgi:hypothetical protein
VRLSYVSHCHSFNVWLSLDGSKLQGGGAHWMAEAYEMQRFGLGPGWRGLDCIEAGNRDWRPREASDAAP